MKIDTNEIQLLSQVYVRDLTEKIASCTVRPFQELYFNSSEFKTKEVLKEHIAKISKTKNPLIYIIEVSSEDKLPLLIRSFEDFRETNIERIKNKDRVNHSRYNMNSSTVLYVGSSTTKFETRMRHHFGVMANRTYSLHLCKWDGDLDYDLRIRTFEVISTTGEKPSRFVVEIIEQQFWDKLKPVFGKRSGL
jgi:hypothetical protein